MSEDWDEIYDDPKTHTIRVPTDGVVLRTRDRILRKKTMHHLFNILIGSDVFNQLGWSDKTPLKFQWGRNTQLGLLRVAVILNGAIGGWTPRTFKVGYSGISNKALPPNVNKIERIDIPLVYSIEKDERQEGLFFLEVILPKDFYLEDIQGRDVLDKHSKTLADSTRSSKELVLDPKAFLKNQKSLNETKPISQSESPLKTESSKGPLTSYDRAVDNGGPIDINDLCKFLKIFNGDQASIISYASVDINGDLLTYSKVLNYANEVRIKQKKPIFSLLR